MALCLGGSLLLCQTASAELRAGAAKADITPDVQAMRVPLGGYAARKGAPATGVHDAVYARALVLSNSKTKVGIVSLDLCFLPANVKAEVVKRVAAAGVKGLTAETLMLAATHTHSAPDPLAMHSGNDLTQKGWTPFDQKLLNFTAERIANAIVTADKNQVPASLRSLTAHPHGLNRNRRGERDTETTMTLVKVTDKGGRTLGLVVNYAAHPTLYDDKMLSISADWPGALMQRLEAETGGVCLFLNGAEGDVTTNGAQGETPEARIKDYAEKQAEVVKAALKTEPPGPPKLFETLLEAWTRKVTLPDRKPSGLFLVAALQTGATIAQARQFVTSLMPKETVVSFVRLDDCLLMGFPCEPTTPLGQAAIAMAQGHNVEFPAIVALANDWLGYALTPEQYKAGGYEAGMSFYGDQLGPTLLEAIKRELSLMALRGDR